MKTNLNELSKHVHENAKDKGFYDMTESILTRMRYHDYFTDQEIKAVKDAFIAQRLMLTVSELGEAMEANRTGKNSPSLDFEFDSKEFKEKVKDSFNDEISDSIIRLADLAGWLGIDLDKHVEFKHRFNTERERMHGGKAY